MKIIKSGILLFALLILSNLNAQSTDSDNNVDCQTELSMFYQSAKIKDYDSAKPHYKVLIENCPDVHLALYRYGSLMYQYYISKTNDATEKKKLAEGLIENYKNEIKYFPEKTDATQRNIQITQLKNDYKLSSPEELYNDFDEIWKSHENEFNDPKGLYTYFSLLIDLQDNGKKSLEDVFKKYEQVMDKITREEGKRAKEEEKLADKKNSGTKLSDEEARQLNNDEIYLANYMKIKESIKAKVGSRADCDNLIPLYEKQFEDRKEDVEWLKLAASRLSAKKCGRDGIFHKITVALNDLEPSAKSAKYLGILAEHSGKTSEALKYYKQSAELEDNNLDKSIVYYAMANIYNDQHSYSTARTYYQKALNNNPSLGKAYLKIANMYVANINSCGEDNFHKRAVYWLAANVARSAARVDPSLKTITAQTVEAFEGRAPSKSEIFNAGMAGKTINIGCWINKSITVPNL